MEYKGMAQPLQPGDIERVAESIGVPEAAMRAVIEIEANGRAFDSLGHPTFLFEPHRFYKNVPKDKLAEAIRDGLAYPRWKGPGSYPKTPALRWQQFQKAVALDETAAIKSASWGLGQIMGEEYDEAGYNTPQEMLVAFCDSEFNQLQGMANLIKVRNLDDAMRSFPSMAACRQFAKRYNGAAYERNNYHNKLHDAHVKWDKRLNGSSAQDAPPPDEKDDTLRIGDKDKIWNGPVRTAQRMLRDLGYSLKVDGDFGPGTRTAILAWQANNDMQTTGELSPADIEFLKISPPMPIQAERANATVADLKPQSSIVQKTSLGKKIMGWFGITTTGAAVVNQTGLMDQSQAYIDKAHQAKGIVVSARELFVDIGIAGFFQTINEWKFPLLLVAVVVGFIVMNQVQKKRLEMHKKAEIA